MNKKKLHEILVKEVTKFESLNNRYYIYVVVVVMGHGSNPLVGRPLVGFSLKPKGLACL